MIIVADVHWDDPALKRCVSGDLRPVEEQRHLDAEGLADLLYLAEREGWQNHDLLTPPGDPS